MPGNPIPKLPPSERKGKRERKKNSPPPGPRGLLPYNPDRSQPPQAGTRPLLRRWLEPHHMRGYYCYCSRGLFLFFSFSFIIFFFICFCFNRFNRSSIPVILDYERLFDEPNSFARTLLLLFRPTAGRCSGTSRLRSRIRRRCNLLVTR